MSKTSAREAKRVLGAEIGEVERRRGFGASCRLVLAKAEGRRALSATAEVEDASPRGSRGAEGSEVCTEGSMVVSVRRGTFEGTR